MHLSDILGTIGVTLLLLAYLLHLRNVIDGNSLIYITLNLIGAVLACISSLLLKFYPFVVLEAIWALVSIISLFRIRPNK